MCLMHSIYMPPYFNKHKSQIEEVSFHIRATSCCSLVVSAVLQVSNSQIKFSGMDLHCTASTLCQLLWCLHIFFIVVWYGMSAQL